MKLPDRIVCTLYEELRKRIKLGEPSDYVYCNAHDLWKRITELGLKIDFNQFLEILKKIPCVRNYVYHFIYDDTQAHSFYIDARCFYIEYRKIIIEKCLYDKK